MLDKKLRDNLRDARNSLFGAVDMFIPILHHTWTYQAPANDMLPYNQNRVTVSSGGESNWTRRTTSGWSTRGVPSLR